MYWADELIKSVDKGKKHRIDDMKTPSGHAHAGSLRAIASHGLIYEAMIKAGYNVDFTYVINDLDPMDGLPRYLDPKEYTQHMGKPLYMIPAPDGKSVNYAEQYAQEYIGAFNKLGFKPQIFRSTELYKAGKANDLIRACLDNVEEVRKIYLEVAKQKKPEGWYPVQVVCENCLKIGSTLVNDWDGKTVAYECRSDVATWAQGCGHTGRISPFNGNGKPMWKLDWPAHWVMMGITIEGAGKDHFSAGGSRDIAAQIMKRVFKVEPPFGFLHEFLLIGGAKMSSSKGNATTAAEFVELLPTDVGRFLFVRTPYQRAINFDPKESRTLPDLFDEYDKCAMAWFTSGNETDHGRMYEAAQQIEPSREPMFLPRFRTVANLMQLRSIDLVEYFTKEKGSPLNKVEQDILNVRIKYATMWLENYADERERFAVTKELPEAARQLSAEQKAYLQIIPSLISEGITAEDFQQVLYNKTKELGLAPKDAFAAIYAALLGKNHGPKAAWLILSLDKDFVTKRFTEIAKNNATEKIAREQKQSLNKPELFSMQHDVTEKFPSACIGIAIIKGVTIKKTDSNLEEEKNTLLSSLENVTTEQLGEYPEIQSYRKLYKAMGVDWHSRRPSPEALLRRVALKKGLYTINTCVDAYNLVVMKHRVSVGAFDYDTVAFPSVLRLAKEGEKILLLGDTEETQYKEGELAYFDQKGGYNMDFNYRDAQRTAVQETTKNLYINVDGIYDITPAQVEKVLQEACDMIIKYCGGTLEFMGIETSS